MHDIGHGMVEDGWMDLDEQSIHHNDGVAILLMNELIEEVTKYMVAYIILMMSYGIMGLVSALLAEQSTTHYRPIHIG